MSYASVSLGQDIDKKEVPSVVLNAFQQKFSKAEDIDWERKKGFYKVEFEVGSYDYEAWITAVGDIVQYEQELHPNQLPTAVKTAIAQKFIGYKINDAEKLVVKDKTTYTVELENASEERKVGFNAKGEVIENKLD